MTEDYVGQRLAQKLNFTRNAWLAEYFLKRYPTVTPINTSLSQSAVNRLLKNGYSVEELLKYHMLSPDHYQKAVQHFSAKKRLVDLVRYQTPENLSDLVSIVRADSTDKTANWLMENWDTIAGTAGALDVLAVLWEKASLDSRLHWLAQKEKLEKENLELALTWLREIPNHEEHHDTWRRDSFFASHGRGYADAFLHLENETVNCALVRWKCLPHVRQQRRVLELDALDQSNPAAIERWLQKKGSYFLDFVRRSSTNSEIRKEVSTIMEKIRHTSLYVPITVGPGTPATIKESPLEKNRHESMRVQPQGPQVVATSERRSADKRSRSQLSHRQYLNRNLAASSYVSSLRYQTFLGFAHTQELMEHLGKNKNCWDAFLSLVDVWTGTLDEVVLTAANLD